MTFALVLLRKFWPVLAGAILLFALWRLHSNAVQVSFERGVKVTETKWKDQSLKEADEARQVVAKAQAEAESQKVQARQDREQREEQERVSQKQKETERANLIHDLESRYRKALAEDQTCAAWSKQPVSCPLR